MEKDEWYSNRILWRVNQHGLLDKNCFIYFDLPEKYKLAIEERIKEVFYPIIAFWESNKTWTVLGTRTIYSFHNGKLIKVPLDEIAKKVNLFIPKGMSGSEAKKNSNYILLGASEEYIWAPAGQELMGLMNILLMFPLGNKK